MLEPYLEYQDVNVFLEHRGVKGMRWGVRRAKSLDRIDRVAAGTASKKANAKRRIIKGVAITGGIAATAFVSAKLARQGTVPLSQLRLKDEELVRIKHFVERAAFQNPVQKNAANEVRRFVNSL